LLLRERYECDGARTEMTRLREEKADEVRERVTVELEGKLLTARPHERVRPAEGEPLARAGRPGPVAVDHDGHRNDRGVLATSVHLQEHVPDDVGRPRQLSVGGPGSERKHESNQSQAP